MFKEIKKLNEVNKINYIKTIKQQTYYYCSAAVIKMCINTELSQYDIFKTLNNYTVDKDNWYVEPDAVYKFLLKHNNYLRTSDICSTSIEATKLIISNMIKNEICAPMLVLGGKHWVLYSGYKENNLGKVKGIYIRDPWPTIDAIVFYPFTKYFFEEFFCPIDVNGKMKGKVEAYILSKPQKDIDIEVTDSSSEMCYVDEKYLNDYIIEESLKQYGFSKVNKIKSGGAIVQDLVIFDKNNKPKFVYTLKEINDALSIIVIDIDSNNIIAVLNANAEHLEVFNKERIKKYIYINYGVNIGIDAIKFVYDENLSSSCFDPVVKIDVIGEFNLLLNTYKNINKNLRR